VRWDSHHDCEIYGFLAIFFNKDDALDHLSMNRTPVTVVYGRYIYTYELVYKPTYNWLAPSCTHTRFLNDSLRLVRCDQGSLMNVTSEGTLKHCWPDHGTAACSSAHQFVSGGYLLPVGGLEHEFYDFPYIGNVIIPTDFPIFQRGNHQPV